MKIIYRTIGVALISITLAGCTSPGDGAAFGTVVGGALGYAIGNATHRPELGLAVGAAAGMVTGAIIGEINQQQRAYLQQHAPQTLQKIQANDAAYAAQKTPANPPIGESTSQTQPQQQAPSPQQSPPQMQPLTVDDIKALAGAGGAGVKDKAVTDEIQRSNSRFTQADISQLQQANVSPSIIAYIQKNAAA